MLSKTRITIISVVAAFGVAGLTAVPASAARNICTGMASGHMICRPAKGCTITLKEADGSTTTWGFSDGETESISGKNYKCEDGKWVALTGGEGGIRPASEATRAVQPPSETPPPRRQAPPPPAGSHA